MHKYINASKLTYFLAFGLYLSLLTQDNAMGCPAYVYGYEIDKEFKSHKSSISLLKLTKPQTWETLPLQIDFQDKNGSHDFSRRHGEKAYQENDRFSFYPEAFGEKADKTKLLNCQYGKIYELSTQSSKNRQYAYLYLCPFGFGKAKPNYKYHPYDIFYDTRNNAIVSKDYSYIFNPENYMLFKNVAMNDRTKTISMASDSKLYIYSDIKNFFSLSFEDEIVSTLNNYRNGPNGLVANVNFYLDILFFKIKLALVTDVNFFKEAAHIPMQVHTPYDTNKYLHPGSGILYSWKLEPNTFVSTTEQFISFSDLKNPEALQRGINKSCRGSVCTFTMNMHHSKSDFAMTFKLGRDLIEKGFFPVLVKDLDKLTEVLDWPELEYKDKKNRIGIYFETTKLGQGDFGWDFWMKMVSNSSTEKVECPQNVSIRQIL